MIHVYAKTKLVKFYILFFCRDKLQEVVQLLRNTSNPQVEFISRNMKKWARENQVNMQP